MCLKADTYRYFLEFFKHPIHFQCLANFWITLYYYELVQQRLETRLAETLRNTEATKDKMTSELINATEQLKGSYQEKIHHLESKMKRHENRKLEHKNNVNSKEMTFIRQMKDSFEMTLNELKRDVSSCKM